MLYYYSLTRNQNDASCDQTCNVCTTISYLVINTMIHIIPKIYFINRFTPAFGTANYAFLLYLILQFITSSCAINKFNFLDLHVFFLLLFVVFYSELVKFFYHRLRKSTALDKKSPTILSPATGLRSDEKAEKRKEVFATFVPILSWLFCMQMLCIVLTICN